MIPQSFSLSSGRTLSLEDVQANILHSHGRDYTWCHFLQFNGEGDAIQKWVRDLADRLTSAQKQLNDREERKLRNPNYDGGPVLCFFLSADGFKALRLKEENGLPGEFSPQAGLRMPETPEWEKNYHQAIHAMVLTADDDANTLDDLRAEISNTLRSEKAGRILFTEKGKKMVADFNGRPRVVEHFGYADGISQPQFFDRNGELLADKLAIAFSLNEMDERLNGGSYFVFWKLEQDVDGFLTKTRELAEKLSLPGSELAGALAVGRFRDGTPVTLFNTPENCPTNNFDYTDDATGLKCPFHAHIRKANPRFANGESEKRRIVRRGVTYGSRQPDLSDRPKKGDGAGLLFMSYQGSIKEQFEFMLDKWINRDDFPANHPDPGKKTGVDPLLGRWNEAKGKHVQWWNPAWNRNAERKDFDFRGLVTSRGGVYLFAPPISFLKKIGSSELKLPDIEIDPPDPDEEAKSREGIVGPFEEKKAPAPRKEPAENPFSVKNTVPARSSALKRAFFRKQTPREEPD